MARSAKPRKSASEVVTPSRASAATARTRTQPGPGAQAPPIQLSATDGSRFDLAAWRGKQVLLYFEEGVGCEPCWTHLPRTVPRRS